MCRINHVSLPWWHYVPVAVNADNKASWSLVTEMGTRVIYQLNSIKNKLSLVPILCFISIPPFVKAYFKRAFIFWFSNEKTWIAIMDINSDAFQCQYWCPFLPITNGQSSAYLLQESMKWNIFRSYIHFHSIKQFCCYPSLWGCCQTKWYITWKVS